MLFRHADTSELFEYSELLRIHLLEKKSCHRKRSLLHSTCKYKISCMITTHLQTHQCSCISTQLAHSIFLDSWMNLHIHNILHDDFVELQHFWPTQNWIVASDWIQCCAFYIFSTDSVAMQFQSYGHDSKFNSSNVLSDCCRYI